LKSRGNLDQRLASNLVVGDTKSLKYRAIRILYVEQHPHVMLLGPLNQLFQGIHFQDARFVVVAEKESVKP
jgi:hypothetical protein